MTTEINLKNFAAADEVRTDTEAFETAVGFKSDAVGAPRPDLNGYRLKAPGNPKVYLVDQGYRRWIPDPTTYNNLFRDWNGIVQDPLIFDVPEGLQLASGTVLARGSGTAPVYLVEPGSKRWIVDPHTMDVYYFSWDRIYAIPPVLLAGIPNGPNISAP
jgi:hypothetical protein